ncbi:unnamed protein product [Taenia asiatica]|uniref:Uncharacterized protein n=1 Tax=Taenia asiatica TaxID=60517 RepID=A0A0R3WDB2_TAEAS|nr:unnamed protein product [Taenia asiatica]
MDRVREEKEEKEEEEEEEWKYCTKQKDNLTDSACSDVVKSKHSLLLRQCLLHSSRVCFGWTSTWRQLIILGAEWSVSLHHNFAHLRLSDGGGGGVAVMM